MPIRQRHADHIDTQGPQENLQLVDPCGIRAVTLTHRKSVLVNPEHVPAFSGSGRLNFADDRNVQRSGSVPSKPDLGQARFLSGPAEQHPLIGRERWVIGKDRIKQSVGRHTRVDHLDSKIAKLLDERPMFGDSQIVIWWLWVAEDRLILIA